MPSLGQAGYLNKTSTICFLYIYLYIYIYLPVILLLIPLWICDEPRFESLNYCNVWPDFFLLFVQELEKALSEQDFSFLGDLIACLLQGCYQRTDIT